MSEQRSGMECLPSEIRQNILTFLDTVDQRSLAQVSWLWYAETRRNFVTVARSREHLAVLLRQDAVCTIRLRDVALTNAELEALVLASNIRGLDFLDYKIEGYSDYTGGCWATSTVDMKLADPGLLGRALNQLEEVTNLEDGMTDLQLTEFLKCMNSDSRVKKLSIGMSLKSVDPLLFATAAMRLEELDFDVEMKMLDCNPNQGPRNKLDTKHTQHLTELFVQMSKKSNLKRLRLRGMDLSLVNPNIFAEAIAGLEVIDLGGITDFYRLKCDEHIKELFALIQNNSRLKSIKLDGFDLTALDSLELARSLCSLTTVNLANSKLTSLQEERIFFALQNSAKIKKLSMYLSYNGLNPDPHLNTFATAVNCLEEAHFEGRIGSPTVSKLFDTMLLGTNLKKLTLSGNYREVEKSTFVTVLNNLQEANIDTVEDDVLQKLFLTMEERTKLKTLTIHGNFQAVDQNTLGKAINRLTEAALHQKAPHSYSYHRRFPLPQAMAVLTGIAHKDSCLKTLSLGHEEVYWCDVADPDAFKIVLKKALQKCRISLYQLAYGWERQLSFNENDILSFARCILCGQIPEDDEFQIHDLHLCECSDCGKYHCNDTESCSRHPSPLNFWDFSSTELSRLFAL